MLTEPISRLHRAPAPLVGLPVCYAFGESFFGLPTEGGGTALIQCDVIEARAAPVPPPGRDTWQPDTEST